MSEAVLICIPCWNEAPHLQDVIAELRRARPEDDLVVVDDDSTDGTGDVARAAGCRVLQLPVHLGYGGALQVGIRYGMRRGYGVVISFDGDGQHDPADVAGLVEAVAAGADLVVGSRVLAPGAYQGSSLRRSGRRFFALAVRALTGLRLTDPTSGLKGLSPRAQALFERSRFPDRYPDADALVLASRAELRVEERPARMRVSLRRREMHAGLRVVSYGFNMLLSLFVAALGRDADLGG